LRREVPPVPCRHKCRHQSSTPARSSRCLVLPPHGGRGHQNVARCTEPEDAGREMDASDSELQLPARYGQNEPAMTLGRSNWLFAGSLRAGRRAAVIMSLIQSAKLNGHDPYRYLKDVLERLPTHPASRIDELLPHRWQPPASDAQSTANQLSREHARCDARTTELPDRFDNLRR
jgi:hypothetical protein